ncbi:MAG: hypothetical protein WCW68_09230 [Methanothrix sp.]
MNQTDLLAQMNGRAITNGWDVVCAMSAERISKLFEDKYNKGEQSGLLYKIEHVEEFALGSISLNFHVGPPLISFIKDDPTRCLLRLEIKDGVAELKDKSGGVVDSQKIPSKPDDPARFIIAIIPLVVIQGKVENGHDVVIGFDQTESVNINLNFDDTVKGFVTNGLKNYFKNNVEKKNWSLGTLIYKENPELIYLTPTSFEFATSVRPGDATDTGCLMLFITTKDGIKGTANELTGKDGKLFTPYPDGHSAALIISNRLFYERILLPQIPNIPAQWAFKPGETKLMAGYVCTTGGSIKYRGYHCLGRDQWDINGFTLRCNEGTPPLSLINGPDGKLNFQWNNSWSVHWRNVYVDTSTGGDSITTSGDTPMTLSIINPEVKMSVSEPDQVISFENHAVAHIQGPPEESGWLKILEQVFGGSVHAGEVIQAAINEKLPKLNIPFKGVNVFAASNLLFPEDHIITYDLNGVFTPGDLVIFGTTRDIKR